MSLQLVSAIFLAAAAASTTVTGHVTRLADGDTLTLAPDAGGKAVTVRMVGIDTPELHLPSSGGSVSQGRWAEKAADRLRELAPVGASISLETWGDQSYGRAIGRVLDDHGGDVNLQMVEEGWAAAYVICSGSQTCKPGFLETQHVDEYMAACERAMSSGLGIYDPADPLPEQPFEFRARIQGKKPFRPVGDLKTGKLYAPDEYPQVPLCQRIFFGSRADAQRLGFR